MFRKPCFQCSDNVDSSKLLTDAHVIHIQHKNPAGGRPGARHAGQDNMPQPYVPNSLTTDTYIIAHSPGKGAHSQQASTHSSTTHSSSALHSVPKTFSPYLIRDADNVKLSPQALINQKDIITASWPNLTEEAKLEQPQFSELYELIKAHALPNCVGAKVIIESGLKVKAWEQHLREYHDKAICCFIKYGWPVGYHARDPPVTSELNHPSASKFNKDVQAYIDKELALGALIGPFKHPPFLPWTRCSPIMTRAKKDSMERRIVVDLTFPEGQGVNAGIDIEAYYGTNISYTLPSISDLLAQLQLCDVGARAWKADLARAYRQLRIDPLDSPLMGIKVGNDYFLDRCPAFGCKTSSAACQRLSNAVVYMMSSRV